MRILSVLCSTYMNWVLASFLYSIAAIASEERDIADESFVYGVVLSTKLVRSRRIRVLWMYTTKYIRAMVRHDVEHVEDKTAQVPC